MCLYFSQTSGQFHFIQPFERNIHIAQEVFYLIELACRFKNKRQRQCIDSLSAMGLVQTFNKIAEAVVNHPLISADRSASDNVVVQLSAFLAQAFLDGLLRL